MQLSSGAGTKILREVLLECHTWLVAMHSHILAGNEDKPNLTVAAQQIAAGEHRGDHCIA